jgi:hypothetical protein
VLALAQILFLIVFSTLKIQHKAQQRALAHQPERLFMQALEQILSCLKINLNPT